MLSKHFGVAPQAAKIIGTIGAIGPVAKREEFEARTIHEPTRKRV